MQRYLRTKLATDWEEPSTDVSLAVRVLRKLELTVVSNPTYHPRMHLVKEWLIEFDGEDPGREIGLGLDGKPILAGPTSVDYGFWLDTNMRFSDFEGKPIEQSEFDEIWSEASSIRAGLDE